MHTSKVNWNTSYLTATEAGIVGFLSNSDNKVRDLTFAEGCVHHTARVVEMGNKTQAERKLKEKELADLKISLKHLEKKEGNWRLADELQEVLNGSKLLEGILATHPYVKYAQYLDSKKVPKFARMYLQNIGFNQLVQLAKFKDRLFEVLDKLPKGVDTFLHTSNTQYAEMRKVWVETKQPELLGYVLNKGLQGDVNMTFDGYNVRLMKEWELLLDDQWYKRARLEVPVRSWDMKLEHVTFGKVISSVLVCTSKTEGKDKSVFRFVLGSRYI